MEQPVKGRFVAASVGLHLFFLALSTLFAGTRRITPPPVIQVHIIPDAVPPPNADFQHGKILDVPPPEKLKEERPDEADALASFDARATTRSAKDKPHFAADDGPRELRAEKPRTESEQRKREAETPKSDSAKKTDMAENRFSPVPMTAAKSDQAGQPAKSDAAAEGTKPDRETKEMVRALSGVEIDSFAAANPAGTLETPSEIVIPLNTRRFGYIDYFTGIKRSVEAVWAYPYEAMNSGAGGSAILRFTVLSSGALDEVRLLVTSGTGALDNASMAAVRNAAPFSAFPAGLDKEKIHVVATFTYQSSFGKVP